MATIDVGDASPGPEPGGPPLRGGSDARRHVVLVVPERSPATSFAPLLAALPADVRAIVVAGVARTTVASATAGAVEGVRRTLDRAATGAAVLIGHGAGGRTAIATALAVPHNVSGVVLLGTVPLHDAPAVPWQRVRTPVLALWGARDATASRREQHRLVARLRHARLLVYPDAGHDLHAREPARAAVDIASFVREVAVLDGHR